MIRTTLALSALALATAAFTAPQAQAADFSARIGAHSVNPKNNNGTVAGLPARVGKEISYTGGFSWHINDNFSADLWLGLAKFEHEVSLVGAGAAFGVGTDTVATVEHRPVTLGVNYHFGSETIRPFIGLGYAWVNVSGETGRGALDGVPLSASNSNGLTYVLGLDINFTDSLFLRVDARNIDFDTDVTVPALGGNLGTANVDPWVYGLSLGFKF